jgi:hypothetical protein
MGETGGGGVNLLFLSSEKERDYGPRRIISNQNSKKSKRRKNKEEEEDSFLFYFFPISFGFGLASRLIYSPPNLHLC